MDNLLIILLCLLLLSPLGFAKTITKTDSESNKKSWILTEGNLELKIAQIPPEQAKAFYLARGFSATIASEIANNCMMQAIAKNTGSKDSKTSITILLKEWQVKTASHASEKDQQLSTVKLKESWDKEWAEDAVTKAARIAFRWATFPTEQTFEPHGDYNWGMISLGLPAGTTFDLKVTWHQDKQEQSVWIHNLICAEDSKK